MKKLALAGLFSILATISLSGCNQAPVEETQIPADDTTQVVQEETAVEPAQEMSTYKSTSLPLQFEYPSDMHIEIYNEELSNGISRITLGEEYSEGGYLLPLIRITVEEDTYAEVMAEIADGPYSPLENKCENEDWAEAVWDCKTKGAWTTYLEIGHQGDLSFGKTYFMDNKVEGWTKVEVRVDLFSDDLGEELNKISKENSADSIIKAYKLDAEQLRRIELADALVASLTLK
jgi:hypothetical protein